MLKDENTSLKEIFQGFLKEFYIPEMADFLQQLEDPIQGKNLEEMSARIQRMREMIMRRLDAMYQESSYTKEQIDQYMSNPDNFSRREWDAMRTFQEKMESYSNEFEVSSQGAGIREIVQEGRKRSMRKKGKLERFESAKSKWIPMQ